ncbi:unnamed protein product, partial [Ectocarpus sp. 12 AP-2014]
AGKGVPVDEKHVAYIYFLFEHLRIKKNNDPPKGQGIPTKRASQCRIEREDVPHPMYRRQHRRNMGGTLSPQVYFEEDEHRRNRWTLLSTAKRQSNPEYTWELVCPRDHR